MGCPRPVRPTKSGSGTYVQLTEAEAAFRTLKSEVKVRPIWHWTEPRVKAHVLVAFLGYCLWVCLKKKAQRRAPSLTPWQMLDQLGRIALVEVWFELRDGRRMCLPRITQPEPRKPCCWRNSTGVCRSSPRRACLPETCHQADRRSPCHQRPTEIVWPTGGPCAAQAPEDQTQPCQPCEGSAKL